jgi:hypothetical protein
MNIEVEHAFRMSQEHIITACEYLEDLITQYWQSGLDSTTLAGRIDALRAKINYLRGLKLDSQAHPWCDDNA